MREGPGVALGQARRTLQGVKGARIEPVYRFTDRKMKCERR